MSAVDPHSADAPAVPVMAPYHGAKDSQLKRFLRRIFLPALIVLTLIYGLAFGLYGSFYLRFFPIPLVLIAVVAVWALPEMKRAPSRTMSVFFFAFFLSLILWPGYLAIALPGLPWITVLRLLGAPMTLMLAISVSVSADFRRDVRLAMGSTPWLWRLLVLFGSLMMLTVFVSDKPVFSLQKTINAEMFWIAIYFVSVYVFLKQGRPTLWAALFCLTVFPICAIAYKEQAMGQVPWAGHIPSFLKIEDESVQRILAGARRGDDGEYRVQTTFTTPLGLGEYLALVLPFLIHFVASPIKPIYRVACAAIIPVALWVVLLSDSRLGLIGCILAFLFYIFLWGIFWWRRHKDTMMGPTIVLSYPILVVLTFISTLVVGRFRNKIWGSGQYEASNEGRSEMYREGIPMVLKHPWGYGPGRGAEELGITNLAGVLTIDTYYLLIGLEYGVIGFLLYYGTMAFGVGHSGLKAIKVTDARSEAMLFLPLTCSLTNFFLIKSVFSNDENHPLVFMMLGMVTALCYRYRDELGTVSKEVREAGGKLAALPRRMMTR
jgi:hypothetical protein